MFRHQWIAACHTSVPQSLRGCPAWWTAPDVGGVSTGTVRSAGWGKTKSLEKNLWCTDSESRSIKSWLFVWLNEDVEDVCHKKGESEKSTSNIIEDIYDLKQLNDHTE